MTWTHLDTEIEELFGGTAGREEQDAQLQLYMKSKNKEWKDISYARLKANPEKWAAMLERSRKWKRDNPEKVKEYKAKQRERANVYQRVWRAGNERYRAQAQAQQNRHRSAHREEYRAKERARYYRRKELQCSKTL